MQNENVESSEIEPVEDGTETQAVSADVAEEDDSATDGEQSPLSEGDTPEAADTSAEEPAPEPEAETPSAPETLEAEEAASKNTEAAAELDESEDEMEEVPSILKTPPDDGIKRRWYAIHAHSGQEGNVQESLRVKSEQMGLADMITNIFVPMEEVAEFKSGEKRLSKRKFFPGYVLVQLPEHPEKNADLWHLIKDTPGVTGFIGSRTEPVPLEDTEVMALVEEMQGERERPRPKLAFEVGERVKINDGAFSNFLGNIGEINEERGKMKVLIEIFERQTSVEVEFWQVEKI